jgi:hypothetical protein
MSVIVLGIEQVYWQDVLTKLVDKGLPLSHAVVHYRYKNVPNQFFDYSKIAQIDGKKFYRTQDIAKLIEQDFGNDFVPVDKKVIDALEDAERDFYILTDRFCFFPRSFRYRKKLFREAARYWLTFFARNNITALFISRTPHNLADYTAYHVAKYLGIPTKSLAHSMINDHVIVRDDYREKEKVPEAFLANANEEEIKANISASLLNAANAESNVLKYVISKNDKTQGVKNLNVSSGPVKEDFKKKMKRIIKRQSRFIFNPPKFKGALAMNGVFPPFVRRVLRIQNKIWQRKEKKFHDQLAINADLNANYIYFAMHMQPERTSTPEAGLFEDHLLAIDILSKSVPDNWMVYVKENPRQYDKINLLKGRHQRDRSDYQDILRLPNVRVISQKIPSKELIANAKAVSTLSGSVGWETLKAGKPCIIFANAWYAACRSVDVVSSVAECKQAIQNALKSSPEKIKLDVLRYLAFMKDKYSVGNLGDASYLRSISLPYSDHVEKMAERLYNELGQFTNGESSYEKQPGKKSLRA